MLASVLRSDPDLQGVAASVGIDVSVVDRLLPDLMSELAENSTVRRTLDRVRSGETLNQTDARSLNRAMLEVILQDRYIEPFQGLLASVFSGDLPAGGFGEQPFFIAMVDDSQFLLYSLGPNRSNDLAAVVGAGGDDILIWPPISALRRANQ